MESDNREISQVVDGKLVRHFVAVVSKDSQYFHPQLAGGFDHFNDGGSLDSTLAHFHNSLAAYKADLGGGELRPGAAVF